MADELLESANGELWCGWSDVCELIFLLFIASY